MTGGVRQNQVNRKHGVYQTTPMVSYAQKRELNLLFSKKNNAEKTDFENNLKELGLINYDGVGEIVKGHYANNPQKQVSFKKVGNAANGRSICVDSNGNLVIVAHDGTILKSDYVKNPEKYEQAQKRNEARTRNRAGAAANEFYQISDGNSGLKDIKRMQQVLDEKIDKNNIVQFLEEYDKYKQGDSSIIHSVTKKIGASGSAEQKKVLTTIMERLSEAAKDAGVSDAEIKKANADFLSAYNVEYKSMSGAFRKTNPKDMEKAMDSLLNAITAKRMSKGEKVDESKAIKDFKRTAVDNHNEAASDYNEARKHEGWAAATGDTICGWFGCKTREDMLKQFGNNKELVEAMFKAKTEAEFKEIYQNGITTKDGKKIPGFGVPFDASKMAAKDKAMGNYQMATNLDESIKKANKLLSYSDKWKFDDYKTAIKNNFGYSESEFKAIMDNYAIESGKTTLSAEEKKLFCLTFLQDTKDSTQKYLNNITAGRGLEGAKSDYERCAQSAFGTSDLAKDVAQFNENMMITEMVTEAGAEIAGTIALQFLPGLGQLATAKLAATSARWGNRAVKITNYVTKSEKIAGNVVKGFQKTEKALDKTAKGLNTVQKTTTATRSAQITNNIASTGVATAAVDLSNGKSVKETMKKSLMNMSFSGVGAASSVLAPKLMQTFGIADRAIANEIAEEIINAAGSYGITKLDGGEYGQTDAFIDFASGLIISRLSHVKGEKPVQALKPQPAQTSIAGYHRTVIDGVEYEFPIRQNADGTQTVDMSTARRSDGNGGYEDVNINMQDDLMASSVNAAAFRSNNDIRWIQKQIKGQTFEFPATKNPNGGLDIDYSVCRQKNSDGQYSYMEVMTPEHITQNSNQQIIMEPLDDDLVRYYETGNLTARGFNIPFLSKKSVVTDLDPSINLSNIASSGIKNGGLFSQNGKCYIRNGNTAVELNVSKKTLEKLFPNEKLQFNQGGSCSCWFLSGIDNMYDSPSAKTHLLKMFSEDANGNISIKFPGRKRAVVFPKGKPLKIDNGLKGDPGVAMLEQAMGISVLKKDEFIEYVDDIVLSDLDKYDIERGISEMRGSQQFSTLMFGGRKMGCKTIEEKNEIIDLIRGLENGVDETKNIQIDYESHRRAIKGYKKIDGVEYVLISNPYNAGNLEMEPLHRLIVTKKPKLIVTDYNNLINNSSSKPINTQRSTTSQATPTNSSRQNYETTNADVPITNSSKHEFQFEERTTRLRGGQFQTVAKTIEGNNIDAMISPRDGSIIIRKNGKETVVSLENGEDMSIHETSTDTYLILTKDNNGNVTVKTSEEPKIDEPSLDEEVSPTPLAPQKRRYVIGAETPNTTTRTTLTSRPSTQHSPKPQLEMPPGAVLVEEVNISGKLRRRIKLANGEYRTEYNGKWMKF